MDSNNTAEKTEGNKDSHSNNDNASAARCLGPLPFFSGKCEPVGGKDEESQRNDNEMTMKCVKKKHRKRWME